MEVTRVLENVTLVLFFYFFVTFYTRSIFFQPLATTAPSSTQSEPVAVKQEKTVSCSTNVTSQL